MNQKHFPTVQELNELLSFAASVKRGEELHPGPHSLVDWWRALQAENQETNEEFFKIYYEMTELANYQRLYDELISLAVIAYRMAKAIEKEHLSHD